ncbi:MAG: 5-(carboxyamino)imidazole ribonucleotide synthase [Pseudomonadota bacterium]
MKTLGIIGGGQLGRMLALSAIPLGVRCRFLVPKDDAALLDFSDRFAQQDPQQLARFARGLDAATTEIETIDPAIFADVMQHVPLWPTPRALDLKRDRRREREHLAALDLPQPRWAQAATHAELAAACSAVAFPCRVKAASGGYDGRGQWKVASPADIAAVPAEAAPWTVEAEIDFRGEFSQVAVRAADGEVRFWTPSINVHRDGILVRTEPDVAGMLPAAEIAEARRCLHTLMQSLDYRGVLAVEFFRTGAGILINEFAPRVHNSGHWTIEGALTSQFENHVRAVSGLPLGDTALRVPVITWNVLGAWPDRAALLAIPGLAVHDYGKAERAGRKIGHVTLQQPDAARIARVEQLLANP